MNRDARDGAPWSEAYPPRPARSSNEGPLRRRLLRRSAGEKLPRSTIGANEVEQSKVHGANARASGRASSSLKLPNVATAGYRPNGRELVIRIVQRDLVTDSSELTALRSWASRLLEADPDQVSAWRILHLELPAVEHINSLGISFLYWLAQQLERRRLRMRISIASAGVRRVARFCRFEGFAEVRDFCADGENAVP